MSADPGPSSGTQPPNVVVRRLVALLTGLVAVVLTVVLWPLSFVVAGIFAAGVGIRRRSLPRPVRLGLVIAGLVVAVTSALILADFTWGSARVS